MADECIEKVKEILASNKSEAGSLLRVDTSSSARTVQSVRVKINNSSDLLKIQSDAVKIKAFILYRQFQYDKLFEHLKIHHKIANDDLVLCFLKGIASYKKYLHELSEKPLSYGNFENLDGDNGNSDRLSTFAFDEDDVQKTARHVADEENDDLRKALI